MNYERRGARKGHDGSCGDFNEPDVSTAQEIVETSGEAPSSIGTSRCMNEHGVAVAKIAPLSTGDAFEKGGKRG